MFTIKYKGFYIHGYCDKPLVRVQAALKCSGNVTIDYFNSFKSLYAAKCKIAALLKEGFISCEN